VEAGVVKEGDGFGVPLCAVTSLAMYNRAIQPFFAPAFQKAVAASCRSRLRSRTVTDEGELLFPAQQRRRHAIMSENTINKVLRKMGYKGKLVGHGFRALASTTLNENGFAPDVIERQLAHAERNKIRAAYNRAQYLPERRKMMQWWADYLDQVGAKN
jgi:integrase